MQNSNLVSVFSNGSFGTDTSFIQKGIKKGGDFLAQLLNATVTREQCEKIVLNQKGAKRFIQSLNFALSGDVKDFDAVTAYMVSCVVLTKDKTISYQNAHFLCGIGSDNATHIKGVSKARVGRFIGNAGTAGTITSKVSRTTGKNGFFTALNITEKSDKHSFTLTDNAKNNALILAYAYQLEKMTDSTFLSLKDKQKGK